jgi:mono/diheme cytochrome c family protein
MPSAGLRAFLLSLALSSPAFGQQMGDVAEGRRLATSWCANCHQVGPQPSVRASDAIPTFASIAALPSTTPMSIRAFLHTSHRNMPNFNLSDTQIDDVSAYILSLRNKTQ